MISPLVLGKAAVGGRGGSATALLPDSAFLLPPRASLGPKNSFAAGNAGSAGTHRLEDRAAVDRLDERIQLGTRSGELDGVGMLGDIENTPAEYVGHAFHLVAILPDCAHLDQHELPFDVRRLRKVYDLDDVDQLVELLGDLLDHVLKAPRDDGHARQRRGAGRG